MVVGGDCWWWLFVMVVGGDCWWWLLEAVRSGCLLAIFFVCMLEHKKWS